MTILFISIIIGLFVWIRLLKFEIKNENDNNKFWSKEAIKFQSEVVTLQQRIYDMSNDIIKNEKRMYDRLHDLQCLNSEIINRVDELKEEIQKLESENVQLKEKLETALTQNQ